MKIIAATTNTPPMLSRIFLRFGDPLGVLIGVGTCDGTMLGVGFAAVMISPDIREFSIDGCLALCAESRLLSCVDEAAAEGAHQCNLQISASGIQIRSCASLRQQLRFD